MEKDFSLSWKLCGGNCALQRPRPTCVLSLSHTSGKKSRSKSELPSWFCKGPSSCAFCCRNSGVVLRTRSLPGSTKTKTKKKPQTRPWFSSRFSEPRSVKEKHNFGRSAWRPAGKALLSFRYFFFQFTERKCVRKVCGLRPEACKVQITTPDKCSYKLKQK